jgi:hypothetical protein
VGRVVKVAAFRWAADKQLRGAVIDSPATPTAPCKGFLASAA